MFRDVFVDVLSEFDNSDQHRTCRRHGGGCCASRYG